MSSSFSKISEYFSNVDFINSVLFMISYIYNRIKNLKYLTIKFFINDGLIEIH